MVGGLADWFAVTALFRHPLGLPIPHTAIIPRNKDRIGEALATFLKENFLIAVGGRAADAQHRRRRRRRPLPARARKAKARASAHGASRLIADIFEGLDDERLGGIVKGAISSRLKTMEVSPLLGHALASAINEDRHVPMLEAAIRWTARALDANEALIREMVHKKRQLGAQARRARRQARRRDHRRPAQADGRNVDRPGASGPASRSRRRSPSSPTTSRPSPRPASGSRR